MFGEDAAGFLEPGKVCVRAGLVGRWGAEGEGFFVEGESTFGSVGSGGQLGVGLLGRLGVEEVGVEVLVAGLGERSRVAESLGGGGDGGCGDLLAALLYVGDDLDRPILAAGEREDRGQRAGLRGVGRGVENFRQPVGVEDRAECGGGLDGLVDVVPADVQDIGRVGVEGGVASREVEVVVDQDLEGSALFDGPAGLGGADAAACVLVGGAERGLDLAEALDRGAGERGRVERVGREGVRGDVAGRECGLVGDAGDLVTDGDTLGEDRGGRGGCLLDREVGLGRGGGGLSGQGGRRCGCCGGGSRGGHRLQEGLGEQLVHGAGFGGAGVGEGLGVGVGLGQGGAGLDGRLPDEVAEDLPDGVALLGLERGGCERADDDAADREGGVGEVLGWLR
ncbi:hypothetical protein [Streptomyces sp. NPDC096068]|uniref:hypothetical protein n=1 Tax=Streptomyces sp. NPDC096068 TaxID=3155424 RepID=UPI00333113E5